MYGQLNASGLNTSYIISLGKFDTLPECERAFLSYYDKHKHDTLTPRSFVYYTPEFSPAWAKYCYIRTDTWWHTVPQGNVISGRLQEWNHCFNDWDCELNGHCDAQTKKCVCKAAWTGDFCQYLNFKWGSRSLGYHRPTYSQWGGDTRYDPKSNRWILYAAEMYDHCGINACCCGNSQIVRAYSHGDNPGGPYTYDRVIIPYFSHEPNLAYDPVTKKHLLWHWGNGNRHQAHILTNCSNGRTQPNTSPGCGGLGDAIFNHISWADDLDAPPEVWMKNMIAVPGQTLHADLCPANPLIFPNGTVLGFWIDRTWRPSYDSVAKLMTANSWNTTYTMHTQTLWISNISDHTALEDPFLWYDKETESYHTLFHGMIPQPPPPVDGQRSVPYRGEGPLSEAEQVARRQRDEQTNPIGSPAYWVRESEGRHAYSLDGKHWVLSPHFTYNTSVCYTDAPCYEWIRRERPHLIFDPKTGEPTHLSNAFTAIREPVDASILHIVPLHTKGSPSQP
eukprot:TRINITY_DN69645_c0_g1_i1.p1 TRINITY_DN69645_c0_g1~~TRINITY_DN69645_c0_g1_i1.p1  ORF type:complete len:534 (-),score=21.52 TRINITY_DN69645_c0_g1_i1:29-1546(-)